MPDYADRIGKAYQIMARSNLDALLLTRAENLFYFTGFWGAAPIRLLSLLLQNGQDPLLILPKLEEDYARSASWVTHFCSYVEFIPGGEPEDPTKLIRDILVQRRLGNGRIGLELDALPVNVFHRLSGRLPDVRWGDATSVVMEMRQIKSPEEIAKVREASHLVDRKVAAAVDLIRPGVSELELGIRVAYEAALEQSFLISPYNAGVPVVATGARSALPHGRASTAVVEEGDLLVIDLCAIAFYQAYHAGFTRTFSVGEPSSRQQEIYRIVLDANVEAINAVRPGATAASIDRAARDVITKAGYGDYFTHRTGRSVGLDVGEPPYLRQDDQTLLQPGMTIVIEPGIYLPGYGGVRVEDTVLVTDGGHERLTQYPSELINTLARRS